MHELEPQLEEECQYVQQFKSQMVLSPTELIIFISSIEMSLIEKIKEIFLNPKELAVFLVGTTLFSFYAFYARNKLFPETTKQINISNSLELSIPRLLRSSRHPMVIKIVIIESTSLSEGSGIKSMLITNLKNFLSEKNLRPLVSCTPLKIYDESIEAFTKILSLEDEEDEAEYFSYLQNGLRFQLVFQKTIEDIDRIQTSQSKSFMICDTNCLDLRVKSNQILWKTFIQKKKINEENLKNCYDYVFHIEWPHIESVDIGETGKKNSNTYELSPSQKRHNIQESWKGFKNFYTIHYKPRLIMQENVEIAIKQIIGWLSPALPKGIMYEKKKVFVKQW